VAERGVDDGNVDIVAISGANLGLGRLGSCLGRLLSCQSY